MSNRQLKILVGALVVLLVGWGVARLLSSRSESKGAGPFDLAASAEQEIDSVTIAAPDVTVRLVAGEGWTVNGYQAVPETGESLRHALEGAEVGQLVSRNPDNHARLGVAEGAGRLLTVYAGGAAQLSLIIGDRAHGVDRAYARRPGEDEVYTLSGTLVSLANRAADDWRDRAILSLDRESIQRIDYGYIDESFALVRDSLGWRTEPRGASVEASAVGPLLSQLESLRAVGFAAASTVDTLSWDSATAHVRVLGPGETLLGGLTFLERPDEVGYYVRRDGSPVVFALSSYSGEQILKRESDLPREDEDEDAGG